MSDPGTAPGAAPGADPGADPGAAPGIELRLRALRGRAFTLTGGFCVPRGAMLALIGPSGGGKSTALDIIAGFVDADAEVRIAGEDVGALAPAARPVSMLFQDHNLFPHLSALDNVALAYEIAQPELGLKKTREAAATALEAVGLGKRLDHRPAALSGGEQQRVGIARAMIARPQLLLADEPTGNLDQTSGAKVIELMFELARKQNAAVVMITHDPALAARADRVMTMTAGELVETVRTP